MPLQARWREQPGLILTTHMASRASSCRVRSISWWAAPGSFPPASGQPDGFHVALHESLVALSQRQTPCAVVDLSLQSVEKARTRLRCPGLDLHCTRPSSCQDRVRRLRGFGHTAKRIAKRLKERLPPPLPLGNIPGMLGVGLEQCANAQHVGPRQVAAQAPPGDHGWTSKAYLQSKHLGDPFGRRPPAGFE